MNAVLHLLAYVLALLPSPAIKFFGACQLPESLGTESKNRVQVGPSDTRPRSEEATHRQGGAGDGNLHRQTSVEN